MSEKIDITGQRFGRLVVVKEAGRSKQGRVLWRCRCDCGGSTIVRGADLKNGSVKSCGCARVEACRAHGTRHGGSGTRLYDIWKGMRARCNNPNHKAYPQYGGRGIKICREWDAFASFREWALANGYREDLTIDRINNDEGYEPNNCRWASYVEQRHNQRRYK